MESKVPEQPPQGEPEIRHYTQAGDPHTWCGVSLADVAVGELTRDRGATTCPGCTAVLVDAHLFDEHREPVGVTPCGVCNGDGTQRVGDDLEYEVFACGACGGTGLSARVVEAQGLREQLAAVEVPPYADVERVEVGADGCGCPVTREMVSVDGELRGDIEDTDRTEHRAGCWAVAHYADAGKSETRCGIDLTKVPFLVQDLNRLTCSACGGKLDDIQQAHEQRRRDWTNDRHVEHVASQVPTEPERRTVGLEVLTDDLRATGNALFAARAAEIGEAKPETIPADAVVAVVIRQGALVEVFDTDAAWRRVDKGQPVSILRDLLSMMPSANGLHGLPRTELLMPTPAVLAALAGTPDARLLSAPVHVLAMDIQAGMLLYATDDDGDGAETLELVSAERDCTDPECINGATCVVLTVDGHEDPDVHFNGYARIQVRIPVAVTR